MTDYRFTREDHELLQELAVFVAELRLVARPDDIIELLPAEPAIQERLRRGNAAARAALL